MSGSRCPIHGCKQSKEAWHLTCRSCWRLVARETQQLIWRLFTHHRDSPAHRGACFEVLDKLNRRALAKEKANGAGPKPKQQAPAPWDRV